MTAWGAWAQLATALVLVAAGCGSESGADATADRVSTSAPTQTTTIEHEAGQTVSASPVPAQTTTTVTSATCKLPASQLSDDDLLECIFDPLYDPKTALEDTALEDIPVPPPPASRPRTTVVFMIDEAGAQLNGSPGGGWTYGVSGECWVGGQTGTTIYAGITHSTIGGATVVDKRRYNVWEGERLRGRLVKRSANRWDILRKGRQVGHTIGLDGPQAATVYLLLGRCA